MKKTIFFLFVVGFFVNAYSQEALWSVNYYAHQTYYYSSTPKIIPENENLFKVVGKKKTPNGQRLSVVEYDISGSLISEQVFGDEISVNHIDYEFDNSGHVYIIAQQSAGYFSTKIVFQKYLLNGDLVWTKEIQDTGYSYDPLFLSISENNTIFITAQKYIFDYDYYYDFTNRLYAYDTDGTQLWERIFDETNELDSIFKDFVYNNELYLFGMDSGTFQVFKLIKVDTNNNMILNAFTDLQNGVSDIQLTSDNKLLITSSVKYRISKLDLDGNLLWSEYYQENPSIDPYLQHARATIQDEQGNIYLTGRYWKYDNNHSESTNNDILTLKFDSEGNLLWHNLYQYGGLNADVGNTVTLKNGYVYVGGYSQGNGIETHDDYVVLKIDAQTGESNGLYRYTGAEGDDFVSSIYVFEDNKVAITGMSHNGTDYDWTTQLLSESSFSVENIDYFEGVKLYPNPLDENQLLSIEGDNLKSYTVYSLTGQVLQQGKFESGSLHSIQLQNLSKGVYLLKLNADKQTLTKKIVIR